MRLRPFLVALPLLLLLTACAETLKLSELSGNSNLPAETSTTTSLPTVDLATERRANGGLMQIRWSASAYDGTGVMVGVIDSGIDVDHEEFSGAIHADSYNVASSNTDLNDELGHGTNVAGVIGARENYKGFVGVAPNVSLMVLKTDRGGTIFESSIARAFRYADEHNVPITNLSLVSNRDLLGGTIEVIRDGMQRGMLVVGAAGNDGLPEPSWPASFASFEGSGAILAVGSVDANGAISSFSNRAGTAKAMYLVAPGENIVTSSRDGNLTLASGTSVAAPFVSGAAAVLLTKDPHLTGADLAKILLTTAQDLGITGVDDIYGHGLLDLEAALRPVGATRVVSGATVASSGTATSASSASFSTSYNAAAVSLALQDTLVLDDFDRSYLIDPEPGLTFNDISLLDRWTSQPVFGFQQGEAGQDLEALDLQISLSDSIKAPINARLSHEATSGLMLAASYGDLSAWRDGETDVGLLSPRYQNNLDRLQGPSLVFGGALPLSSHWSASARYAQSLTLLDDAQAPQTDSLEARLDYRSPLLELGFAAGQLGEEAGLLGAELSGAFGAYQDEHSHYLALEAARALFGGLSLEGQISLAYSRATTPGGLVAQQSSLLSSGFDASLVKEGLLTQQKDRKDRLALTVAQPLRVVQGQALIDKPVARALDGQVSRSQALVDLSPEARQLDLSLSYGAFDSKAQAGLDFMAGVSLNPGHVQAAPELSLGLRFKRAF